MDTNVVRQANPGKCRVRLSAASASFSQKSPCACSGNVASRSATQRSNSLASRWKAASTVSRYARIASTSCCINLQPTAIPALPYRRVFFGGGKDSDGSVIASLINVLQKRRGRAVDGHSQRNEGSDDF